MSINSVTGTPVKSEPKTAPVEAVQAKRGGKDIKNEGNTDDGAAAKLNSPKPVTNLQGQSLGRTLNVSA